MVRNEKGFTYPLTFCFILLISLLLTIYLEQFLAEKRLLKESIAILKQEYYFLSSVMNVENELWPVEEDIVLAGVITYSDGQVEYRTESIAEGLLKVTFDLQLSGYPVVSGVGYYDREARKMIKWIEKN